MKSVLREVIDDDRTISAYRPRLTKLVGSVTATILLQQISFLYAKNGNEPFCKFRSPCEHKAYKPGDSWTEELGFGLEEFDCALKKIGQKISKDKPKESTALVWYWTTIDRMTYYELNVEAYENVSPKACEMANFSTDSDLRKWEDLNK